MRIPMSFLRLAGKAFDWIGAGLWVLSGAIMLFSIASVITDVIFRLLFKRFSLPWVVEVNEYLLFALTFFSSVWCLRKGGHIRIDFVYDLFSERTREVLSTITNIVGAAACFAFSFYGGYATWYSFDRGTHLFKFLKLPKYAFTLVICVCAFLLAVEFLRQVWDRWESFRSAGHSHTERRA
jgi:C4-dicarboxylate transporter DctQ subunit